ncbi:hypothetical protein [Listeria monocytogenes]|uniref:hypothetical protein n=1 Tax=Listeria monocytogenes TaxID=1639 RepID=UPI001E4201A6|nr:hypothetical protein [Listeria monocytogenes]MCD2223038.1 hypothetical protein [Listeria monocytogenes]
MKSKEFRLFLVITSSILVGLVFLFAGLQLREQHIERENYKNEIKREEYERQLQEEQEVEERNKDFFVPGSGFTD